MSIAVLGIDLGKSSCSLVGLDEAGRVVLRRRMRRETVLAHAAKLPACVMAMASLLRRPSHGPGSGRSRTRGATDVAGVRAALRQSPEER